MDRPLRFVKRLGAIYRVLLETPAGCWLTDCNGPSPPFFEADLHRYERVPAPESWISEQTMTPAQEARLKMIQPLLDCTDCISDKSLRYQMAAEIAQQNQTTTRRILRLYYRYLATGRLMQKRKQQISESNQIMARAIRRYYYGSKRLSLRAAYEMMLLEDYVGHNGEFDSDAPTWSQFRHYYYDKGYHKNPQKVIAREGLTKYQRDHRPAWGSSAGWRPQPGSYQMDATQADIYLVSRKDRSIVVGRPYIYMAVDTNKLYDCSGGIPAYIIKIFGESQVQALLQGHSCIDEKVIQRAVDLLAVKVPRTYAAGTHISDFEIGMDPPAPPLEQEEVPRQYAVKRGRKAAQRDDGDLLVAYNNGVDIEAHLKKNGYLEADYHGKDELDP